MPLVSSLKGNAIAYIDSGHGLLLFARLRGFQMSNDHELNSAGRAELFCFCQQNKATPVIFTGLNCKANCTNLVVESLIPKCVVCQGVDVALDEADVLILGRDPQSTLLVT